MVPSTDDGLFVAFSTEFSLIWIVITGMASFRSILYDMAFGNAPARRSILYDLYDTIHNIMTTTNNWDHRM